MAKNSILGSSYLILCHFVLFICFCSQCFSYEIQGDSSSYNSFTLSSFAYSKTGLKPYEWRYIRVDLPPWFSSMSIALESDVDLDLESIRKVPKSSLPLICFREGSPPLPDANDTPLKDFAFVSISNASFGRIQGPQNTELCYPMQKNISVKLTNEQISPGSWYLGLFNGIGPMRTRSKMITRGPTYSFSGNVSVEGCATSMLWGQYCNQTVDPLSCVDSYNFTENLSGTKLNQTAENIVSCRNSYENSCLGDSKPKIYFLDVVGIAEQLTVIATDVKFNGTPPLNGTWNGSGIILMCYARHGAMPLATLHDYSGNINNSPLVIRSPKVGRWYIAIQPVNTSRVFGGVLDTSTKVCYSLDWQVHQCPIQKAGLNCTWERYMLQTVLRKNPSVPFESFYTPVSGKVSSDSANFPLEPLLSNSSNGGKSDVAWTYFLLDIPYGATGGNVHVRLTSDAQFNYEIYARYGGLPSLDSWDYFYANTTSSSNGSMFFKLYDSSEETVSFYILYARGGTWSFGLRHLNPADSASKAQTTMSISLERCPRRCSSHGTCQSVVDASGLTLYSYCYCDRDHGGFDCGIEIVSHGGHIWQSIFLIASNAAAVLPAYWALRQKAFAEWVIYTSSGISSGLYHACDVGTWCALSFHVLQFMDFWLSFMAVVSTFVYLAAIDEGSKRTIHTVVAILTGLMAETGPTRSRNIVLVIAIGTLGLLIGWLIEFCTNYRSYSFSTEFCMFHRWQTIRDWLRGLLKKLLKCFRWGFVLAGFTALAMAVISWILETTESYWIWHSVWHVSIYTSSFLFLCSKAKTVNSENQRPPDGTYELTRQDSFSRGG
uniref:EGF-like domain-containing protein n=1 Tax=Davidia involucrata TaxID=16924 RepID=A0A5B7BQZ2_DAVIN